MNMESNKGNLEQTAQDFLANLELESIGIDNLNKNELSKIIIKIIDSFSLNPWTEQSEIFKQVNLKDKGDLIKINNLIRNSSIFQDIIINKSFSYKYWKTILPFYARIKNVIDKKPELPKRIAIFPGVSCMFYCGFCGRNQNEKYQTSIIDEGVESINRLIDELDADAKISISGGLEPLTNPRLYKIIDKLFARDFKIPLITNGYSLTKNYVEKNPSIWKLSSLRISLYGHDEISYKFITRVDKSFLLVNKKSN